MKSCLKTEKNGQSIDRKINIWICKKCRYFLCTWVCRSVSSPDEELHPVVVLGTVAAATQVDPLNEDQRDKLPPLVQKNLGLERLKISLL